MPREARNTYKSNLFHVMAQGIEKKQIFASKEEKAFFIRILKNKASIYNIKVIVYCIMGNHYHMLVEINNMADLSSFMHIINTVYGIYYNNKYNRVGHVFRSRFKCQEITNESYYYNCIKYILYNPVKARICSDPFEYEYSNAKRYAESIDKNNIGNINLDCSFIDTEEESTSCNEIIDVFLNQYNLNKKYLIAEKERLKELIKLLNKIHGFSYREISEELGISQSFLRRLVIK